MGRPLETWNNQDGTTATAEDRMDRYHDASNEGTMIKGLAWPGLAWRTGIDPDDFLKYFTSITAERKGAASE